ncbi:pilin [Candidatus Uhrbacteria bacterium]|nr:pilin [Candidatus Uhrbacteria bacterium]
MSRHSFITACLTASLVLMPVMASAQLTAESTGLAGAAAGTGLSTSCTGTDCLLTIIGNVINIALGFMGVVLLVMLLYAGFLWMTSGGDTKGVQAAKTMITNAVAGVVIVAVSYAITGFVLGQLATISGEGGGAAGGGADACASFDCVGGASFCPASRADRTGCEEYDRCCS